MNEDVTAGSGSGQRASTHAEAERLRSQIEELLHHRYELLELIGQDGSELCFRARDPRSGRAMVLVALMIDAAALSAVASRLPDWAKRINSVSHYALPRVIDWGVAPGLVYFVVEAHVEATLELIMGREDWIEFEHAIDILRDVASALDELHRCGLRHGALSPSSILVIGSRKSAMLVGAGLTDALRDDPVVAFAVPAPPAYQAPELWADTQDANGRVDQYALAVIAYELVSGRRRASIDHATGLLTVDPVHLPPGVPLRPELPLHVNAALARAFSPRANLRYDSASEFVKVLSGEIRATPAGMATEHPTTNAAAPSPTGALLALLALFFVVSVGAVLIFLPEERSQAAAAGRSFAASIVELPQRVGISKPRVRTDELQRPTGLAQGTSRGTAPVREPITTTAGERLNSAISAVLSAGADTATRRAGETPARQTGSGGASIIPMGFVAVSSDPAGAQVYVGSRMAGRVPHVERLRPGEYQVSVRSPDFVYLPGSSTVTVRPGDTVKVHFTARAAAEPPER